LSADFVEEIYKVAATGPRDNLAFIIEMKDGTEVSYWGDYASPGSPGVFDFINLPGGLSPSDVKSIKFVKAPPSPNLPSAADGSDFKRCFY
jgi:hypothetical protein